MCGEEKGYAYANRFDPDQLLSNSVTGPRSDLIAAQPIIKKRIVKVLIRRRHLRYIWNKDNAND